MGASGTGKTGRLRGHPVGEWVASHPGQGDPRATKGAWEALAPRQALRITGTTHAAFQAGAVGVTGVASPCRGTAGCPPADSRFLCLFRFTKCLLPASGAGRRHFVNRNKQRNRESAAGHPAVPPGREATPVPPNGARLKGGVVVPCNPKGLAGARANVMSPCSSFLGSLARGEMPPTPLPGGRGADRSLPVPEAPMRYPVRVCSGSSLMPQACRAGRGVAGRLSGFSQPTAPGLLLLDLGDDQRCDR